MDIALGTLSDNPCNVLLLCMLGIIVASIHSGALLADESLSSDLLGFDRINVYLPPLGNIGINVFVLAALVFAPYGICKLLIHLRVDEPCPSPA